MKSVSDDLRNLLATGNFVLADLYTLSLVSGPILYLTTADRDITISGITWVSTGPLVDINSNASGGGRGQQSTSHQKTGLDVDTKIVSIQPRAIDLFSGAAYPDRIGSAPFITAVAAGALDGATVQMDRGYWPRWSPLTVPVGAPTDIVRSLFAGRVASVEFDRGMVNVTFNSHLELLATQIPRNVYGPSCRHTLFDAACGLSAAAYAVAGTISAVTSRVAFVSPIATPQGSGTYALGRLVMTSGGNQGFSRMVRSWDSATGAFRLSAPLPYDVFVGDTFAAYPGCDKSQATCAAFGNTIAFGGHPYIPSVETAI